MLRFLADQLRRPHELYSGADSIPKPKRLTSTTALPAASAPRSSALRLRTGCSATSVRSNGSSPLDAAHTGRGPKAPAQARRQISESSSAILLRPVKALRADVMREKPPRIRELKLLPEGVDALRRTGAIAWSGRRLRTGEAFRQRPRQQDCRRPWLSRIATDGVAPTQSHPSASRGL